MGLGGTVVMRGGGERRGGGESERGKERAREERE